ncbi:hypothetical protein [Rothia koreensis]|uniref:hypothetical protein n=1 Tax=Rothia koreensis TaxID=592378 RepID=UPI003FCD3105
MAENEPNETNETSSGEGNESDQLQATLPQTLEDLENLVQSRVAQEREKFSGLDEYKQRADQAQALTVERDELVERIRVMEQDQKLRQLRNDIAAEFGLDADLLRGESAEEIQAHATSIRKYFPAVPNVPSNGRAPYETVRDDPAREAVKNLFTN